MQLYQHAQIQFSRILKVLTLSLLWVLLAASVTVIAMLRKAPPAGRPVTDSPRLESGRGVAVLALLYGVALLAGFLYITKFLVSSL